jgi:single-strand DNA-binding protein
MAGRGLNKVQIIGNLGKDPEMKYTPSGKPITTFSVAVGRVSRTPEGENRDETEWFRVVAWDKLAETCNQYLRKGSKVYIEGRLQTRQWKDNNGADQKMVEIVANEMLMLDSRQGGGEYGGESRGSSAPPASRGGGAPASGFDDSDDDIPF